MPVLILFGSMLLIMLMRVFLPIGVRPKGKVEKTSYLSLPERALLQRVNMYSIGAVLLLMSVTGTISTTVEVVVVIAALVILALPMRYLLTNEGIGINNVVFRPWTEFVGFRIEPRRIVLIGKEGLRPLSLSLLGAHQRELLPVLRRHLSEAKAGKAVSPSGGRPRADKPKREPLRRKAWL
jgi:hypothetical protein